MAEVAIYKLSPLRSKRIYFAHSRIRGKLIRRSLKTKVLNLAKLKLADLEKEERSKLENVNELTPARVFLVILSQSIVLKEGRPLSNILDCRWRNKPLGSGQ